MINHKHLLITPLAFLSLTTISGALLASSFVSADNDSVVDEINITVPVSCTLSGTGMNTHNASIPNGTYDSNIGETTMKAFCNDNAGFAIYAIGYTDNEDGKNVLTNSTLGNAHDIVTGTATSGNTSNWAMKLSTVISPTPTYPITIQNSFDSFHNVPDDYTLVAKRTSGTDIGTSAEGSTLKSTYQAYISQTQPAGTYTGQVKYTMVHPNDGVAPEICEPTGTTINTITCMQDISSSNKTTILASMTEGTQYTLIDKRDKKRYTVSKLADGNIWMTQNLDLDLDSSKVYTNEDTDIGWNSSTGSYDTASWTPIRSTYTENVHSWCEGGFTNQYNECSNYTPESYDPGKKYWNGILSDSYTNPSENYISSTGIPQYSLGNYYNWAAAIALNDISGYISSSQNADRSICPAGWTLPKSGNNTSNGSFLYLFEQYGFDYMTNNLGSGHIIYQAPFYYNMSGVWTGLHIDVGSNYYIWSSESSGIDDRMCSPYIKNDSNEIFIDPFGESFSYFGQSVRCLVRN